MVELRGFLHPLPPPPFRRRARGEKWPASVGYVTFPEQLFHPRTRTMRRRLNFPGKSLPATDAFPFPLFLRETLSLFPCYWAQTRVLVRSRAQWLFRTTFNRRNDIIVQNNSNSGYSANKHGNISLRKLINFVECFTDWIIRFADAKRSRHTFM